MGVAALVLAVVGLTICWIPAVGWVGVVLALVSVALGIVAMVKGQKGLGIVGLVLGAVGIVLGLVIQIMTILAVGAAAEGIEQLKGQLGNKPASTQPF